jgi:AhpC/TSA family/Disulphide bond corrector protein DsbC
VELQRRYADITRQGLGLIAISYDSPETLKAFTASRGVTFPLVSDQGSVIIKRFGLLNDTVDPKSRTYGIPHPGTLMVDRKGVVQSRYFEDAYQERYTTGAILSGAGGASTIKATTAHLSMTASLSDSQAAPGERLSLVADLTPASTMHVYAPGKHSYQVVRLEIDPHPWLKIHPVVYPPSTIYHFKPLDERVEVFVKPFRLRRDLTLLATPEAQKLLASMTSVTISGAVEYQACDDKVCFNPARVPVTFTVALKGLDRRPPGD